MKVQCPTCFRPIEQRGFRLHIASCKGEMLPYTPTSGSGWSIPSMASFCWFLVQLVGLSLLLFVGYQLAQPLFWFWSSLWSLLGVGKDVVVTIQKVVEVPPAEYAQTVKGVAKDIISKLVPAMVNTANYKRLDEL